MRVTTALWQGIQQLGLARLVLIAIATAALIWLVAIALGAWAVLFLGPAVLVYLAIFGAAFASAIGRLPLLGRAEGLQFFIPMICAVPLVLCCGFGGMRAAQLLNQHVLHMPDSFLREVAHQPSNQAMQLTASEPAVYASVVGDRERMLRGTHRRLAAADLVSR